MLGPTVTTLDYLASYCLDGSSALQVFCEVDPSIEDSACGTPIVFQVPAPQPDESMVKYRLIIFWHMFSQEQQQKQ